MLNEGWDANTVTHILGIRAFSTQLLCEQVVGRALRRESYDLNEEDLNLTWNTPTSWEYPFEFTDRPPNGEELQTSYQSLPSGSTRSAQNGIGSP